MKEDVNKIAEVIRSCETLRQHSIAAKMVGMFIKKHPTNIAPRDEIYNRIRCRNISYLNSILDAQFAYLSSKQRLCFGALPVFVPPQKPRFNYNHC